MKYVDVHAHLDYFEEGKIEKIIERAREKGVKHIVNNGTDKETNKKTVDLSKKYSEVKPALGIYPEIAQELGEEELENQLKFISENSPIAIGEVGLDYKVERSLEEKNKQQIAFEKQIEIAKKLNIPLIVHSRKAEQEVLDTLIKLEAKKVIFHAFHGKIKILNQALEQKYYFSIPTNINRSSQFKKMVETLPLNRILTETDSPFLSFDPDVESEPCYVSKTIEEIAKIKGMTEEETSNVVFQNFQQLFSI